jgi:hypothetical protein
MQAKRRKQIDKKRKKLINIIYCGPRHNELGQIDILGQLGDKYMCMVVKDGKGSIEWLTESQIS